MSFESLSVYAVLSFGSLFAILNPFNTIPPFLAMTSDNTAAERLGMARRACAVALSVMAAFGLFGMSILNFFGITVPAFQVAGGLVILQVSLEMLQGSRVAKVTPEESREGVRKEDISITPLAVPILCGPGSITTAILLGGQAQTWFHLGVLLGNMAVIYTGTFLLLRLAARHAHALGEITLKVISRLMGLLLVAIAVQFILDGIDDSGILKG